jgi:hypothetical protein
MAFHGKKRPAIPVPDRKLSSHYIRLFGFVHPWLWGADVWTMKNLAGATLAFFKATGYNRHRNKHRRCPP